MICRLDKLTLRALSRENEIAAIEKTKAVTPILNGKRAALEFGKNKKVPTKISGKKYSAHFRLKASNTNGMAMIAR